MLKKLVSLLLSLLICLSLLPSQAGAVDALENKPPIQAEASEAARPDDPDELVMPTAEFPVEAKTSHSKGQAFRHFMPRYSFCIYRTSSPMCTEY